MNGPILVVLAAGMGSRYGGLKQMDKIGRNGEVLLDYSVYDAVQSGFEKIVFIIRHDIENDFRELVLTRMGKKVKCELAFQDPDSLIPPDIFRASQEAGRTKPWGTGHALLCAAEKLDAPFTVINADDFYGQEAFRIIGKHLLSPDSAIPSIVPYKLEKTLSPQGTVARGVCEIDNGYLTSVDELTAIQKKDGKIFNTAPDGSVRYLPPDTPVSMNFWGLTPNLLPEFQKYFDDFLKTFAADIQGLIKSECFIPKAIDHFIKQGTAKVKVLNVNSIWFGVTYKEDREAAIIKIDELTSAGIYPGALWN
jgi:dTDP-glucose pyrophosphorylase